MCVGSESMKISESIKTHFCFLKITIVFLYTKEAPQKGLKRLLISQNYGCQPLHH